MKKEKRENDGWLMLAPRMELQGINAGARVNEPIKMNEIIRKDAYVIHAFSEKRNEKKGWTVEACARDLFCDMISGAREVGGMD